MATDVVTPSIAPPAATSAPAPAAPSTPTPSAPETPVSAPVTPDVTNVPSDVTTPEVAAPADVAARPKKEDYANDEMGLEKFVKDTLAYDREHGEEEAAPAPEVQAEPEVKPEEAVTEPEAPQEVEPEGDTTPEALSALLKSNDALNAAVEASPEAKGFLFKMSRENARLAPIGEIFPNAEAAQFAAETANMTVGIRNGFIRAIDEPEHMDQAFQDFVDMFVETDDKGQPVLDDKGQPVLGKDFDMFGNRVVDNYFDGEMAYFEDMLKSPGLGEVAKENFEAAVQAIKFLKSMKDAGPEDLDRPDLSDVSDETRAYIEKQEAALKAKQEELGQRQKTLGTEERRAARQSHETNVAKTVGGEFGSNLDQMVTDKLAAGVYIPSIALKMVDPASGISVFAKDIYNTFLEKTVGRPVNQPDGKIKWVGGVANLRNKLQQLEMLPPSEDAARQRVEFFRKLRADHLSGIVDSKIKEIQGVDRKDREARQKRDTAARSTVTPEPRGGAAPTPSAMSMEQAFTKARETLKHDPLTIDMDDADREERVMQLAQRYMRGQK